jgi:hypothetical protein
MSSPTVGSQSVAYLFDGYAGNTHLLVYVVLAQLGSVAAGFAYSTSQADIGAFQNLVSAASARIEQAGGQCLDRVWEIPTDADRAAVPKNRLLRCQWPLSSAR